MLELNTYADAHALMNRLGDHGDLLRVDHLDFTHLLFRESAKEIAQVLGRFGPPNMRIWFLRVLLEELGAHDRDMVDQVSQIAAVLTAPDYFEERIVSFVAHAERWPGEEDAA
jgi:hypothetical protein